MYNFIRPLHSPNMYSFIYFLTEIESLFTHGFEHISYFTLIWYISFPRPGISHFSKNPWILFNGKWHFKTTVWMLAMPMVTGTSIHPTEFS